MDERPIPDSLASGGGDEIHGVTEDCVRVQGGVLDLAKVLGRLEVAGSAAFRTKCLELVRTVREVLCEHRGKVEGPGGLFEYIDEGAAICAEDVGPMCEQHCELDQCLREIEAGLMACEGSDAGPAVEYVRTQGERLEILLRQHQACMGQLMKDVSA